nr:MAG TPA: hypothetical protein [Bacteriophage sp.]
MWPRVWPVDLFCFSRRRAPLPHLVVVPTCLFALHQALARGWVCAVLTTASACISHVLSIQFSKNTTLWVSRVRPGDCTPATALLGAHCHLNQGR